MIDRSGYEPGFSHDRGGAEGAHDERARPSGLTVLLVDDDDSVRAAVTRILSGHGYTILQAEHGADALRLAAAHPGQIDLLVTDMYMPGLRGPEIMEKMVSSRPGMAVLFMSGYADEDVVRSGLLPGAQLLRKPFTVEELNEAVRQALGGPRAA
jgi:two-component system cell cycle sensor histidine kinase/response regulator CckA